jgi:exopolyphosphatase/guanosine-5'-triphosphate,3'-diphosphate pyrophosphatase
MLVAEDTPEGVRSATRFREDVRPFAGLTPDGLSEDSIDRIVASVEKLLALAKSCGSISACLVATSAVRDAANADAFSFRILDRTGLRLRVLSGEEEARLSLKGCSSSDSDGVIDIGGGSTEIAVERGGETTAVSLQIGAVRLARKTNGLNKYEYISMRAAIERDIRNAAHKFTIDPPVRWVGVGGTCTTIARIDANGERAIEGRALERGAVERISDMLSNMNATERAQVPGLSAKRVDVIVPGAWIMVACMRALNIKRLIVTERGNLDGVLADPPPGLAPLRLG